MRRKPRAHSALALGVATYCNGTTDCACGRAQHAATRTVGRRMRLGITRQELELIRFLREHYFPAAIDRKEREAAIHARLDALEEEHRAHHAQG